MSHEHPSLLENCHCHRRLLCGEHLLSGTNLPMDLRSEKAAYRKMALVTARAVSSPEDRLSAELLPCRHAEGQLQCVLPSHRCQFADLYYQSIASQCSPTKLAAPGLPVAGPTSGRPAGGCWEHLLFFQKALSVLRQFQEAVRHLHPYQPLAAALTCLRAACSPAAPARLC